MKLTHALAIGASLLVGQAAHAVTVNLGNLGSQTVTRTDSTGSIGSGQYNDDAVDGDTVISSNADITLAFEMTILDPTPASNRTLFDFGANGNGFSLLLRSTGDLSLQAKTGTSQLGGAASAYALPGDLVNRPLSIVASLDNDATASTLNLFINGLLVSSVTGAPITDWAGGDGGGYFFGSGNVLAANFSGQNFLSPLPSEAVATSDLRFYEDVFTTIPEPASALLGLVGIGALGMRRRRNA